METVGVEPTSASLQARCSIRLSYIPEGVRTGGVEPPQREAPRLQRGELTHAQRPREPARGGRPGSNRCFGAHNPGCFLYTTTTMKRGRPDSNRWPFA